MGNADGNHKYPETDIFSPSLKILTHKYNKASIQLGMCLTVIIFPAKYKFHYNNTLSNGLKYVVWARYNYQLVSLSGTLY